MGVLGILKRLIGNSDRSAQLMAELREGTANQSSLLNEKLNAVILGVSNQTELFNSRLKELAAQRGDPRPETLQSDAALELLRGIRDGISNETKVMQEKMTQLVQGVENQSRLLNEKLSELAERIK
jgi:malonyl CoA-acyl carrier protein transacylase